MQFIALLYNRRQRGGTGIDAFTLRGFAKWALRHNADSIVNEFIDGYVGVIKVLEKMTMFRILLLRLSLKPFGLKKIPMTFMTFYRGTYLIFTY